MDRLSAIKSTIIPYVIWAFTCGAFTCSVYIGSAVLLTGCGSESPDDGLKKPPGRFVAVKAKQKKRESLAEFCDVVAGTPATQLRLPETHRPVPAGNGSQWVNVWATWCKPCIKEMPMLAEWKERMIAEGISTQLIFLSVDEEAESLASFERKNANLPRSLHLKDPESLPGWLTELGLDPGAGLPIHVFADKTGAIRCIRTGAISDDHYPTISHLLK